MNVLFSDAFVKSLRIHSAVKKVVQRKVDRIIVDLRIMRITSNIWNLLINELVSGHRKRRP